MNRFYKKIFVYSLVFYLAVTMYTRFHDAPMKIFQRKLLYSLPLEFGDGRRSVKIQTCVLAETEVAEFLRTNPNDCPTPNKEPSASKQDQYLILRYLDREGSNYGDLKVYFSCFKHPVVEFFFLDGHMDHYQNILFPMPYQRSQAPCKVSTHWKNFWGW